MTVKELKAILENIDENKEIFVAGMHGYTSDFVVENMPFNVYVMENIENES